MDQALSTLHQQIHTQHQWRFEAVEESQDFPTGCKTTFKAYSSNMVYELVKQSKDLCTTDTGVWTGTIALQAHHVMVLSLY